MHTLRCLRMMQLKTIIVVGVISVSVTFLLLLYYSNSQPEEGTSSKYVFNHHFLVEHQPLIKKKDKLQVISEKDSMHSVKGVAPSKYKLMAVHTVIRHGDRSPIFKLPKDVSSDLSCLMDTERYSHISKVVNFPHVMAAEMSKNPSEDNAFLRWSMFPSQTTCGEGQLTGQGAIQHILNGIHFSERYIHQHGLFSSTNWHRNVLIHSTEVFRTYQSAIAFVYGMLPNFDISSLIIKKSLGLNFCEDRAFGPACQCSKMENFRAKAEAECKKNPQIKKSFLDYKNLLSFFSDVLGISPLTVPGATSLMDGMSAFTCHNKPFPCNVNGSCISTHNMEALWKVIDTKSDCMGNSQSYKTYSRALMHGLLFRIARNFNISSINGTNAKFHLYSGHDTTVTPLIAALELTENIWPGYAHMITFELWKDRENMKDYVKVLQNGRTVTHEVIFCKDKTLKNGMCSFKHFIAYLNSRNLRSFCFSTEEDKTFI